MYEKQPKENTIRRWKMAPGAYSMIFHTISRGKCSKEDRVETETISPSDWLDEASLFFGSLDFRPIHFLILANISKSKKKDKQVEIWREKKV